MSRGKSALIVFVVVVTAMGIAMSMDYTDTYVANRFHKALAAELYDADTPYSLDAFLEYYDWDEVCVVTPDKTPPELKTQFWLPYKHAVQNNETWSLIFIKSYYVVAEIPIKRSTLDYSQELPSDRFERWAAFIEIEEDEGKKQMTFIHE